MYSRIPRGIRGSTRANRGLPGRPRQCRVSVPVYGGLSQLPTVNVSATGS